MERSAGILLPVFSLPSPYGIGTLGAPCQSFLLFLHAAGQRWWQILPVGPSCAGNSPYSAVSSFAGNPLLIDPEALCAEGLLTEAELAAERTAGAEVDYEVLMPRRERLLRRAFDRSGGEAETVRLFAAGEPWLADYALYQAARKHFHDPWTAWPDQALREHRPEGAARWRETLAEEIAFQEWLQFRFFAQWAQLRREAQALGIRILGDLPIYVPLDSADVWSEREMFLLEADGRPSAVAGVPPDAFSREGQLWGNPLYDWPAHRRDGYGWWIRRIGAAARLADAIRLDHFRAFADYWAIPADAATAREGAWRQGPGRELLEVLTGWFPQTEFLAEDLGLLTPAVHTLRQEAKLPGMKVLEFAFTDPDNAYLPHQYERQCVCYPGTHDNDTILGWYESAPEAQRSFARQYLAAGDGESVRRALLRAGAGSVANLFVVQLQDYLALDARARMNVPGTAEGNWTWRVPEGALTPALAAEVRALAVCYARCGAQE